MFLFLNVGRNRPRTVVSHPFSAACSFLPWAASKSPSLSCGTLLIAVQWAVSTGRPSPLPLFHTLMSSMLHGDPEDSCVVIITVFPLLGPGQQALGQGSVYLEPYSWSTAFYWMQPQDGLSWHFFETTGKMRVACLPDSAKLARWATLVNTLSIAVSCFLRWWLLTWVLTVSFLMRWLQWWSHIASVLMETAVMVFCIRPSMWNCSYSTAFWLHKDSKVAVILSFLIGQMAASVGSTESLY